MLDVYDGYYYIQCHVVSSERNRVKLLFFGGGGGPYLKLLARLNKGLMLL